MYCKDINFVFGSMIMMICVVGKETISASVRPFYKDNYKQLLMLSFLIIPDD